MKLCTLLGHDWAAMTEVTARSLKPDELLPRGVDNDVVLKCQRCGARSENSMNWKIKLYRAVPMASGLSVLGIEELLVYIYQPGEGFWALGALALPVIVWIAVDRRFRRFDWYPYHKSELEPVDGHCPKCGSAEIYKTGRVSRCMDCRAEGIGALSPRSTKEEA